MGNSGNRGAGQTKILAMAGLSIPTAIITLEGLIGHLGISRLAGLWIIPLKNKKAPPYSFGVCEFRATINAISFQKKTCMISEDGGRGNSRHSNVDHGFKILIER